MSVVIVIVPLRDLREEMANVQSKELELSHKKSDMEKQLEVNSQYRLIILQVPNQTCLFILISHYYQ